MNNPTRDPTPVIERPAQELPPAIDNGRTMYVHLCSGRVTEVTSVTSVRVTQSQIVLEQASGEAATFPRRDVYFASCAAGEQPAF
jgi:hypothetical protein